MPDPLCFLSADLADLAERLAQDLGHTLRPAPRHPGDAWVYTDDGKIDPLFDDAGSEDTNDETPR